MTSDGARPVQAPIDESATGKCSIAKSATVSTQVSGTNGNVVTKRSLFMQTLIKMGIITARATNVNQDHVRTFRLRRREADREQACAVDIPSSGTSCTGVINTISGLCLVKGIKQ